MRAKAHRCKPVAGQQPRPGAAGPSDPPDRKPTARAGGSSSDAAPVVFTRSIPRSMSPIANDTVALAFRLVQLFSFTVSAQTEPRRKTGACRRTKSGA
jgi:hypothetical protein